MTALPAEARTLELFPCACREVRHPITRRPAGWFAGDAGPFENLGAAVDHQGSLALDHVCSRAVRK